MCKQYRSLSPKAIQSWRHNSPLLTSLNNARVIRFTKGPIDLFITQFFNNFYTRATFDYLCPTWWNGQHANNDYSNIAYCWYLPVYSTRDVYHWPSRCSCGCLFTRLFIHWTFWKKKSMASWHVLSTDNAKDLWVFSVSTYGTFGGPFATKATVTMQLILPIGLQDATKDQ